MADYILGLREIVGSRPLIMTGATIILLDNQNRILLQQRSDSGYWGLPGGSMELGESFEATARREVLEETGLRVGQLTLLGLHSGDDTFYEYPNGHQIYAAFAVFKTTEWSGQLTPDRNESLDLRFFPWNELPTTLNPPDVKILNKFFLHQMD